MNQFPRGPSMVKTLFQSFWPMKDHYSILQALAKQYGDPMTLSTVGGPIVVTADPQAVKEIVLAEPALFASASPEGFIPILGEHSILMTSGERHKALRKLMSPPFYGARMRAYGQLIRDVTLAHTSRWKPGETFSLQETTQAISLEVIIRAVFGATSQERAQRFHQAISGSINELPAAAVAFKFLRSRLYRPWARYAKARAELDSMCKEEILACQQDPGAREDILRLLVSARYEDGSSMSEQEIIDQLVTMVLAGHETTAIGLAWAIYGLLKNPPTLQKLLEEIDAAGPDPEPDTLARLPYVDAVCQEALRRYPMALWITRKLRQPFTIKGYQLPAGTMVGASLLLHFQEEVYQAPERFWPERFLEKSYTPFQFLTFGGGSRRCLGAGFAMYEMKIVLATILRKHRLRLASEKELRPVLRAATLGPEGGVPVTAEGAR